MDIDKLRIALTAANRFVLENMTSTEDFEEATRNLLDRHPTPFMERVNAVEEQLKQIPELSTFDQYMMAYVKGWGSVTFNNLAYAIIRRTGDVSVNQACEEMIRYIENDHFYVQQTVFISGIVVDEPLDMGDGITIKPFVRSKSYYQQHIAGYPDMVPGGSLASVGAVIIKEYKHPIIKVHVSEFEKPYPVMEELWDFQVFDNILDLLPLFARDGVEISRVCGVSVIGTCISLRDWTPNNHGPIGTWFGRTARGYAHRLDHNEPANLKYFYNLYANLPTAKRKQLRVPLRRLNMALQRELDVDRAVDLGVALELLFTNAKPLDATIGFTLRVRAARLMRDTLSDRKELFSLLGKIYDLRSKAAHDGELPEQKNNQNIEGILIGAAHLTIQSLEFFIMNGGLYDDEQWKAVVLG